jgi:hypothetical protein
MGSLEVGGVCYQPCGTCGEVFLTAGCGGGHRAPNLLINHVVFVCRMIPLRSLGVFCRPLPTSANTRPMTSDK